MPFIRPSIHVYQQLISVSPRTLTPFFELCLVGPTYQVEKEVAHATYNASVDTAYTASYANKVSGTDVDVSSVVTTLKEIKVKTWPLSISSLSGTVVIANTDAVTTLTASENFNTAGVLATDSVVVTVVKDAITDSFTATVRSVASDGLSVTLNNNIPDAVSGSTVTAVFYRQVAGTYTLTDSNVTASSTGITIPFSITKILDNTSHRIYSAKVYVSYRALRTYLANDFLAFENTAQYEAALGHADAQNPLALASSIVLANASITFKVLPIETDDNAGYLKAIDMLTTNDKVYVIVPLTQDKDVISAFANHCTSMSLPEKSKWRVVYGNLPMPNTKIMVELNNGVVRTGNTGTIYLKDVANGMFESMGVRLGDFIDFYDDSNEIVTSLKIAAVLNESAVELEVAKYTKTIEGYEPVIGGEANYAIPIMETATAARNMSNVATFTTQGAHWLVAGDIVTITGCTGTGFNVTTAAVTIVDETTFTVPSTGDEVVAGVNATGVITITNRVPEFAINYEACRVLTTAGIAEEMVLVARSFMNKRLRLVEPDQVMITIGDTDYLLPGYYLCAAYGAMRAGFPPHQGFTTLGVGGIKRLLRSNKLFRDTQLDEMAGGGIFWVVQDVPEALPYCIYQTTTDTTQLETIEDSVVATIDFASKFYKDNLRAVLGRFNVNEISMKYVSTIIKDVTEKMLRMTYPYIGSVIVSGQLKTIRAEADKIIPTVTIKVPFPVNAVDLYLEV